MSTTRTKRGATARFLALLSSLAMIVIGLVGVTMASPASADDGSATNVTTEAVVAPTTRDECLAQADKKWIGNDETGQCVDKDSPGNSGEHKVTICHRHAAVDNPYNVETVDTDSIDQDNLPGNGKKYLDGHGDWNHQGPVFDPEVNTKSGGSQIDPGSQWGDIIPPFTSPEGTYFPGYNWPAGEGIWNNGCKVPTYTYDNQITITKEICYGGETLPAASATGEKFSVTSFKPITDKQKAVVDADALASANAAFAEKYPGYKEGECTEFYYENQITITKEICVSGETIPAATATGDKYWIASNEPITDEQMAAIDDDAQDSADAAFSKKYGEYTNGTCPVFTAQGGSAGYCNADNQNVTVTWDGATSTLSSTDAENKAAANKTAAYQAAGIAEDAPQGTCTTTTVVTEEPPAQEPTPLVVEAATVAAPAEVPAAAIPAPAVVNVPAKATLPAAVPAGEGSTGLPMWALAMIALGMIGAAAAGKQLLGARK